MEISKTQELNDTDTITQRQQCTWFTQPWVTSTKMSHPVTVISLKMLQSRNINVALPFLSFL